MKKKCNSGGLMKVRLRKTLLTMKFFCFFFLLSVSVSAASYSQNARFTISLNDVALTEVFSVIRANSEFTFIYNVDDVRGIWVKSLNVHDASIQEILDAALRNTGFVYKIEDRVIVIQPQNMKEEKKSVRVKGWVHDKSKQPLPGVTVKMVGVSLGTATNTQGWFAIDLPVTKGELEFSFVGYKKQKIAFTEKTDTLRIVMEEDLQQVEEVVVNGYFTQNKNSYTGSVTSVKGEDLLKVAPTNILKALAFMVPGLHLVENNEQGSNPNAIPEIIIRGTTALAVNGEYGLNTPLIILDGVEITLENLYDLDMQDIENVDVLKDASAKAVYGEKAANGVIVITRKRVTDSKLRVRYNFTPNVQFPDVSSFNLCDGAEKLELERLCGIYDSKTGDKDELYWQRINAVERGVFTDWKSIPLRNAWSFDHSVNVSGRGGGMDYNVSLRYGDTRGVMKGDFRQRYGIGVNLSYNYKDFLTVSYRLDISKTDTKDSPYGSFSDWVIRNPYEMPKDEYGEWNKSYNGSNLDRNPLYEASLESFNKSKSKTITNSLNVRVDILKGLYVTGNFNYSLGDAKSDKFVSPESVVFLSKDVEQRGSYTIEGSESDSWSGNFTLSYNWTIDDEGSLLSLNIGETINKSKNYSFSFAGVGFLKPILNDLGFAAEYASGAPSGAETVSTGIGIYGNLNFIYRNRYFVDGSYRGSASSSISKDNRWAPYWAVGAGWNVHNESFLEGSFVNMLRLKASYGLTGSNTLSTWETRSTYLYSKDNQFVTGIGAKPITMANEFLKASQTYEWNLGVQFSLFKNRLELDFNFYNKNTKDMLLPISYPYSVGISTLNSNLGEQVNKGYDWSLSGVILNTKDLQWRVTLNGQHNRDKIKKISNSLKYRNDENREQMMDPDLVDKAIFRGSAPKIQFEEGKSSTAIYVVRSLGIDPATGKEILVKKDGSLTFEYDPADKVAMGNTIPDLELSLSTSFSWKRFSMFAGMNITRGGWIYNSTRASKVEQIDPTHNVDRRAFYERWHNPGDLVHYIGYDPMSFVYAQTERFLEKRNEFYLSSLGIYYEFNPEWVKHIYLKRLRVGVNFSDVLRLSTVKFERGTSYPYMRGFNFTISPTF